MKKKEKMIWKILFVIGMLPFIILLSFGVYNSINGFSGMCFFNCYNYYGIRALMDSVVLYSYIFWPTYIIGFVFIILSVKNLKKKR